jgi:transposase
MLSFPAAINVYLCTVPCDMRRSFDGLSMMAEHVIGCKPYAGHLLVFSNRRTDRVKIFCIGIATDGRSGTSDSRRARSSFPLRRRGGRRSRRGSWRYCWRESI